MKSFMKTVAIVAIGCLAVAAKPASAAKMIGYWEDWNSLPLASVSSNYDVMDVAFGLPGGTDNATISFSETAESSTQFIADVKTLQGNGKKVLLSIGGASAASLNLQNSTDVTSFVNSVEGLVTTYGFNGIDLDLENNALELASGDTNLTSPTTPAVVNLISALGQLNSHYGSSFMITFAPQTLDVCAVGQYDTIYGDYLPVLYATRNYMSYAAIQCYNSGTMLTATNGQAPEGVPDFQVAMSELLLHGYTMGNGQAFPAMTPGQVAFGVIATTAAGNAGDGGYLAPSSVLQAAEYLGSGTTYSGRTYTLLGGPYPTFEGVMTWDANYDNGNGNAMSGALVSYLHSIGGSGSAPGAPGTPTCTPGNAQVALSWGTSSGATSYNVFRGTSSGGESGTAIATGLTGASYTNTGLTNGTKYYYKVAAVNSYGTSGQSGEGSATPASTSCTTKPGTPSTPTASGTTSTGTTISWSAVTPPANCTITSYEIYKGGTALASTSSTSYAVTGLTASTAYAFTVAAVDSDGTGTASSAVNVTTSASGGGCSGIAAWSGNSVAYATGALVTYNGSEYKCLTGHTSEAGWDPVDVPSLWSLVGGC